MKYVGFIKEHDDYGCAMPLAYYTSESRFLFPKEQTIDYLKEGILCLAVMEIVSDLDGVRMGSSSVLTDGKWCWPDYLKGYISKYPTFSLPEEFIKDSLQSGKISLSDEELLEIEKEFLKKFWNTL